MPKNCTRLFPVQILAIAKNSIDNQQVITGDPSPGFHKTVAKMLQKLFLTASEHLAEYLSRNRDRWPHWFIIAVILSAAIVVSGMWMAIENPAAGEIFSNLAMSTMLLFASAMATLAGLRIAYGFYQATTEITADMPPALTLTEKIFLVFGLRIDFGMTQKALSAWTAPDMGGDALVCSLPGESKADFTARFEAEVEKAGPGRWVVVIQKGVPVGMIYGAPDGAVDFQRDEPPFQVEDAYQKSGWRIVPPGFRFVDETEAEYREYLRKFAVNFREWSPRKKISGEPSRASFVFREILKASANISAAILFCIPVFGQKLEQVKACPLGNNPAPAGEVVYQFERAELYRNADGKKTYCRLLESVPGYRDGGGGALIAITASGKVVYKANQTGEVVTRATAMRPRSETIDPETVPGFQIPDSTESAEITERIRRDAYRLSYEAQRSGKPWWDLLNDLFLLSYPFFVVAGGLAYLWAYVSAKQNMYTMYRSAMRVLTWVLLLVASVVLANLFIFAFSLGLHPVMLTGVAMAEIGAVVYVVHKIDPDFRPSAGNDQFQNRGSRGGDFPRITG